MAVRLKKIELTVFQRFFRTETVGGLILLLFGFAALVLANSPLAKAYERLWDIPRTVGIVDHSLSLTLHQWINDGLMAVFFLLVGLEIKRELLAGELSSPKQAALPLACAPESIPARAPEEMARRSERQIPSSFVRGTTIH